VQTSPHERPGKSRRMRPTVPFLAAFALTGTAALAQDTLPQHVIHHAAFGVE